MHDMRDYLPKNVQSALMTALAEDAAYEMVAPLSFLFHFHALGHLHTIRF